ncbi:hypothetical protein [Aquimarina litoralis]|uniref:hypothetical protein n=1 Tax=Aquimarina litoralis TaxID=584605 RepID=UPI001C58AD71|nr:hypothetical protein [Aquimarina litoralis]MBW1295916.1 hypothetical protein [Aquimarina litoralis]
MPENNHTKGIHFGGSIQEYLSIGYVFLLVLGVVSYSIYYGLIGINIISYSNISDILLSPVIIFTKGIVVPLAIIGFTIIVYLILYFSSKNSLKRKEQLIAKIGEEKYHKRLLQLKGMKSIFPAIILFSFYIGYALGGGAKTRDKIKNKTYKADHTVTFVDNETLDIKVIGQNSLYIFYVLENSSEILISPFEGNIKKLKRK